MYVDGDAITNINSVLIKYIPQFIRLGNEGTTDLYHIGEVNNR